MQGLAGSGSRHLAWRPASPEPAGPVQTRRVQGLGRLEAPSFFQLKFRLDAFHPGFWEARARFRFWRASGLARGFLLEGLQALNSWTCLEEAPGGLTFTVAGAQIDSSKTVFRNWLVTAAVSAETVNYF